MHPVFCGIDFGTSNSSIAISSDTISPSLVMVEGDKFTIPSTIFYEEDIIAPIFGRSAVNSYTLGNTGRFMRSLKRVLGTDLMSAGTIVNGRSIKFETVLSNFLLHLKNKAEKQAKQEITSVVMGRPVHFRDNDENGDKKAEKELENIAKSVGFENVLFQFEPIAAAYAHEGKISGEKLACVVDIGGGTSDFTIIKLGKNLQHKSDRTDDILASSGVRIGGNDFDKNLNMKSFMPSFGFGTTYGDKGLLVPTTQYFDLAEWSKVNSVYSYKNFQIVKEVLSEADNPKKYARLLDLMEAEQGHQLLGAVEEAKIALTDNDDFVSILNFLDDTIQVKTKKNVFEKAISQNVNNISGSIENCLKLAGVKADEIDLIVLTGGSTEIPFVAQQLCNHFPNAEVSSENKLSSVGLGLSYDALRRF